MDRTILAAALMPMLALCACERAVTPDRSLEPFTTPIASAQPAPVEPAGGGTSPGSAEVPVLTPEAQKGIEGARDVLLSFARAIENRQFDGAWALLSPSDRQKWPRQEFAKLFAGLGAITVAIPDGTIEGAAGSSYYTTPVTISARGGDGRPLRYDGEAILRRVNDVDGATAAQRRWHFDRLTIDWTH